MQEAYDVFTRKCTSAKYVQLATGIEDLGSSERGRSRSYRYLALGCLTSHFPCVSAVGQDLFLIEDFRFYE